ncbi:MAG TPA: NrfD/PsrC family molybdoenzyme membrane anchor subunit [Ktedonobacteraceae bacterium]|nr:NrfD/PsrC family molybdoenzyme membrane anchor subunit [Ktedonobacteraceae bacterium]
MKETRLPITEISFTGVQELLSRPNFFEQLATLSTGYTPDPERALEEPSYYDYPVLKATTWHWEIIWYFFFGGLAAGCYVIASIAALFGSREDRAVARTGYYLSLLAILPCPLLLTKDLGRPERFLHMLRIFKVKSPMSMGTWGLISFSLFSGVTVVIQAARDGILGRWWGARLLAALPQRLIALPGTVLGVFLGGYTGVLLTATSVPLWSRSKVLGAVFISSAFSTSSALISLVLRFTRTPAHTLHKLERLEWVALLVEMMDLVTFLRGSGRAARPLVGTAPTEHGRTFWRFVFGGGLALPWLLQTLSLFGGRSGKRRNGRGIVISLLVLMGGYFLRRTMIEAGRSSSTDARTTLWNAKR